MALEFPQDDWRTPKKPQGKSTAEEDFFLLMSLALDGQLDAEEEERFQRAIAEDPALANEWQIWQGLNAQFDEDPSIAPPVNFVDSVIGKLALQESSEIQELMSLSLDGLLEGDEESYLQRMMEQDPLLANDWQVWQELSIQFDEEPSMMPPAGLVENVNAGIVMQQRRSRLRLGIVVGAVTSVAWLLLLVALVGAGIYTVMYEGAWLGQQITNLTAIASSISEWFSVTGSAMTDLVNVTYYQMWGVVLGYFAAMGLIMTYWARFLRRSVRDNAPQAVAS